MEGIDYLVRQAVQMGKPIAINISFGNNYGSHELIIKGKHKKTLIISCVFRQFSCFTRIHVWLLFESYNTRSGSC